VENIVIAGCLASGKTSILCALIQIVARKYNQQIAGFKPFDNGLIRNYAKEEFFDGELIQKAMTTPPHITMISPYVANENYPIEMAFKRDGIQVDWEFVQNCLNVLHSTYDGVLIEAPPGLYTPITEGKNFFHWLPKISRKVIWIVCPGKTAFELNFSYLEHLRYHHFQVQIIINNANKFKDQELLFYFWKKLEEYSSFPVVGMIPYFKELQDDRDGFACKVEDNLKEMIEKLFQAN